MRIGMVTGSFDPITNGHAWVIEAASQMVDKLWVVVAHNPTKHCMFGVNDRMEMVREVCNGMARCHTIFVGSSSNEMITHVARRLNCDTIFRGLRNAEDFAYESQMLLVNRRIDPSIQTVFLIPPRELTEVSSSMVKSLSKFSDWQTVASMYVHPFVLSKVEDRVQWQ